MNARSVRHTDRVRTSLSTDAVVAGARLELGPADSAAGNLSADNENIIHWLAGQFIEEPELVLAMLEATAGKSQYALSTIVVAAERAAIAQPEYADVQYYAARAAVDAGRFEAARERADNALRVNPGYVDALVLSARISAALGEPQRAMTHLQQALAAGAEYADVHALIGSLHLRCGNRRAARQAYEQSLAIDPRQAAVREQLAGLGLFAATGREHELPS